MQQFDDDIERALDELPALRALPADRLPALCEALRASLIDTLSRSGGHFAASLGTVELTVALHWVFNSPYDRMVWDVGHQAHGHKLLTGRRETLHKVRHGDGPTPFPTRAESEHDAFGCGHSSTSLSACAGFVRADRDAKPPRHAIAIIGDGGLTAGMVWEALQDIGAHQLPVLIVLNDNRMSISANVGPLVDTLDRAHEQSASWPALCRALHIDYSGPLDGHDVGAVASALQAWQRQPQPLLLHLRTIKGKGYARAEAEPVRYHGVKTFDAEQGLPDSEPPPSPSYSQVFGRWLLSHGDDERLWAITPAMIEGSELGAFHSAHPDRCLDVGIAEQHAATLAAGLAAGGAKPVLAIYSTFLQRALDQVIHDIALQNLDVLIAVDRAGLVGGDGATHNGAFDLAMLSTVPNMSVIAPADERELWAALEAAWQRGGPVAVRYPRGRGPGSDLSPAPEAMNWGHGRLLREGDGTLGIISVGHCLERAKTLATDFEASLFDLRFVKPLAAQQLVEFARTHERLVLIEEASPIGGAGSAIAALLAEQQCQKPLLTLALPDHFVGHGSPAEVMAEAAVDDAGLRRRLQHWLAAAGS